MNEHSGYGANLIAFAVQSNPDQYRETYEEMREIILGQFSIPPHLFKVDFVTQTNNDPPMNPAIG